LTDFYKKFSDTKFHPNPSTGSRADSCCLTDRRTDEQDKANRSFLRHANATKDAVFLKGKRASSLSRLNISRFWIFKWCHSAWSQ